MGNRLAGDLDSASRRIVLVGASVRAAAQSARRAGFQVFGCDQFGDQDTREACAHFSLGAGPSNWLAALDAAPPAPWCYTGGVENFPEFHSQAARRRPLWGVADEALAFARDLRRWGPVATASGAAPPKTRFEPPNVGDACKDTWIWKALASCGGLRVKHWTPNESTSSTEQGLWQEFLAGPVYSAAYTANGHACRMLGVVRQFAGREFSAPGPFVYAGGVGPIPVARREHALLRRLGRALAEAGELRGVFGVDFVRHRGRIRPLEINPRYTAGMELIERSTGVPIFEFVRACFKDGTRATWPQARGDAHGKQIVFAKSDCTEEQVLNAIDQLCRANRWQAGSAADLPAVAAIAAGSPVATVFAAGSHSAQVRRRLASRAARLQRSLAS